MIYLAVFRLKGDRNPRFEPSHQSKHRRSSEDIVVARPIVEKKGPLLIGHEHLVMGMFNLGSACVRGPFLGVILAIGLKPIVNHGYPYPPARCSTGPDNPSAVLIKARCDSACGKLPAKWPPTTLYSSANKPTSLRTASTRSNCVFASSTLP